MGGTGERESRVTSRGQLQSSRQETLQQWRRGDMGGRDVLEDCAHTRAAHPWPEGGQGEEPRIAPASRPEHLASSR